MTSFQKMQHYYRDDIFKDIIKPKTTKNNKKDNSDDNFWDIIEDEEDVSNNLNLSNYYKSEYKNNNNINKNNDSEKKKEKEKFEAFYDRLSKPKKVKIKYGYIVDNNKTIQPKDRKKKRPKSVDINMSKPKEKNKTIKIDELSVFKRNQKWLEVKQNNLNKAKKKINKKKEEELKEYKLSRYNKITSELQRYQIYNEENNVKSKPENLNYFLRLHKMRKEKEKEKSTSKIISQKINLLKYSHYSGIQTGKISKREMNKCIKYIHNKIKGKK